MANATKLTAHSSSFSDERIAIPSKGVSLAARYTRVSPTAPVLILAHGFAGNKDEKGLFVTARDFFAGNGFSVLRFDFRGCGESEGEFREVRLKDLADDLVSVSKYVRTGLEIKANAICLVSFSLAARVAVLAASAKIGAHVFWSPAVYTDRDMAPRYRTDEIEDQIAKQGWFEKGGLRVNQSFLNDLASGPADHSIQSFRRPVLIVHGGEDKRIPVRSSEELIRHLSPSSRLIKIPGADHSFRSDSSHREWLFSATAAWFRAHAKRASMRSSTNQSRLFDTDCEMPAA